VKSELEKKFDKIAQLLDLPPYETEYRFHPVRRFRFDVAWPDNQIAVELEGGIYSGGRHSRGKGFQNDCHKYNLAAECGWTVLRYTGEDLRKDPKGMVDQIKRVLDKEAE